MTQPGTKSVRKPGLIELFVSQVQMSCELQERVCRFGEVLYREGDKQKTNWQEPQHLVVSISRETPT